MQQNVKIIKIMRIWTLLPAMLLFFNSPASAVVLDHLYEAEIAVSNQTRKTRHEIFKKAFQQTLIRVVGSSQVLGNPLIDEARNKVLKYVSQFRYRELPEDFQQPVSVAGQTEHDAFTNLLWIRFDVQAVNNLLRNSNLPVWGKQRPETLVWIAVRDGAKRYILRQSDKSPIKDEIEKAAKLRGIPIKWPDYNAQERKRLSFVDVWGGFWDNILTVSRHYRKESMLVGRYLWAGSEWKVKWDLLTDKHQKYWQINSRDLSLLSTEGVDKASDLVSAKYALFLRESGGVNFYIDIHGINSVDSYARVMSYLQDLSSVKDLNASEINEQGIRF
ncbi:MAG: DUF2066 domain-containing protein, partial [Gammaproteobacteria bacterium]|nr:DUF2066 domain-containing protein [Gammaproteobacteria bacterium]